VLPLSHGVIVRKARTALHNRTRRFGGVRLYRGGEVKEVDGVSFAVLHPRDGATPICIAVTTRVGHRCRPATAAEQRRVLNGDAHNGSSANGNGVGAGVGNGAGNGHAEADRIRRALDAALDVLADIELRAHAVNGSNSTPLAAE
jgi:hypothetical protein